jgi:large subunit ribosomal protein L30
MPERASKRVKKRSEKSIPTRTKVAEQAKSNCIVVIRLRGQAGINRVVRETLCSMMLLRKFQAALFPENAAVRGMLFRVKDYVTWGEPSVETISSLLTQRAEISSGEDLTPDLLKKQLHVSSVQELADKIKKGEITLRQLKTTGISSRFRLHPPGKGFKKTIKRSFRDSGELGYRGDNINALLHRMI